MAVGFKEWEVICEALGEGRQGILLRKGGIHEGRAGFSFAHDFFYLFPTRFHAQPGFLREWQEGDLVSVGYCARVEFAVTVRDWAVVEALAPWHVYTEEVLRERFFWAGKGMSAGSIHLAVVRVSKLAVPFVFPYERRFGGCRSWVEIPDCPEGDGLGVAGVMGGDEFAGLVREVRRLIGEGVGL